MTSVFLDTTELAMLLGCSDRWARNIAKSGLYKKQPITVSYAQNQGGNSGMSYLVALSSLPQHLQDRYKASRSLIIAPSTALVPDNAGKKASWYLDQIAPILQTKKNTKERADVINALDGVIVYDWKGDRKTLTADTLRRWLKKYDDDSLRGLAGNVRADKGRKRVILSRVWDKAVPFDTQTKKDITFAIKQYLGGLIKGNTSFDRARFLAGIKLANTTADLGYSPKNLKSICVIPRKMADDLRHFAKVARHKHDRKASEDDRPRAIRSKAGMQPMEVVVLDVHHMNVLTTYKLKMGTAKLIALKDEGTDRVWCDLIFFEKSGGVRNADVIRVIADMIAHPEFGSPRSLYIDNGSENNFSELIEDLMTANNRINGDDRFEDRSSVIHAKPYNAAAKPIEAWFGQFENQFMKHLQGYIGDDRMNQKRQVIGKQNKPFGEFEDFCDIFYKFLDSYEASPRGGRFMKGKSPQEMFASHVVDGWRATTMEREEFLSIFTKDVTRNVRAQAIQLDNRTWICPELDGYLGDKVIVRQPVYHQGFNEVALLDQNGVFLGIAHPQEHMGYMNERGAISTADRVRTRSKALTTANRSVPDVDVAQEIIAVGERSSKVKPNTPFNASYSNSKVSPARSSAPVATDDELADQRDKRIERDSAERRALFQNLDKKEASNG